MDNGNIHTTPHARERVVPDDYCTTVPSFYLGTRKEQSSGKLGWFVRAQPEEGDIAQGTCIIPCSQNTDLAISRSSHHKQTAGLGRSSCSDAHLFFLRGLLRDRTGSGASAIPHSTQHLLLEEPASTHPILAVMAAISWRAIRSGEVVYNKRYAWQDAIFTTTPDSNVCSL